jgi:hypothetical protein
VKDNWLPIWNERAKDNNPFSSMGRSSYSWNSWFIYLNDIVRNFEGFNKNDLLLDIGGGKGYVAIYFAPWVKKVCSFDYAEEMVKGSKSVIDGFENIYCYVDQIPTVEETKKLNFHFQKVFVGSILKYLPDYNALELTLKNLFEITTEDATLVFSHNQDLEHKKRHIKSYQRLDWPAEKKERAIASDMSSFWIDFEFLKTMALKIGYKDIQKKEINSKLWQSTYMFDFVLRK